METAPLDIQAGDRVKVTVSTEKRDPWLTPKEGWEGVAVAAATNMESSHWQIRFEEPWCSLGITRIMPLASLQIIGRPKHEKEGPEHQEAVPTEETAQVGPDPLGEDPADTGNDESPEEDEIFDDANIDDNDESAIIEEEISETLRPSKGSEFVEGALVRVKKSAGANSDEQHLVRRQGQVGRIIRNCEIATACVEIDFEDGKLPVLIPKSMLQGIAIATDDRVEVTTKKARPTPRTQMKLPF